MGCTSICTSIEAKWYYVSDYVGIIYHVTVNQACKVDTCVPLPKLEDLFTAMSSGKVFTKLDMSQAYLQLPLDDKSKAFNTYKGLFQYNRHLFGVSAPPAVFQKCMHGEPPSRVTCTGISIYLDDILVTGSTSENHLVKLDH